MARILLIALFLLLGRSSTAQTFFYINQIHVAPDPATTEDEVQVQLIGFLSSTGAYVASAQASITGNLVTLTVVAADNGGLTVLVPHTETINLGQLPPGDYIVAFGLNSSGILVTAPPGQGDFTVLGDGGACDALTIASVQWHAFSDTAIVVHVQNNGPVGFDYPGFILFDVNGDTLAKETVNFFAIAGDSWHMLRVVDGAFIPQGPFEGRLELWTGFTSALACTWPGPINLCPPPPCAPVLLTLGNTGPLPAVGSFSWALMDAAFTTIASGMFSLDASNQFTQLEQCLEPGEYSFEVSPLGPPFPGNDLIYGVSAPGGITGPSQPVAWSLPVALAFSFYAPCADGSNGISLLPASGLRITQHERVITVERLDGEPLGRLEAFDAQGRLLHRTTAMNHRSQLRIDVPGVVLLRTAGDAARVMVD